jgi:glycosyltransferase involved in cell wall biosynthesis
MGNIYIVDYLGIHCGMHYYNESFKKELLRLKNINVYILSNYHIDSNSPFFPFFYKKRKLFSLIFLLRSYFKYLFFVLNNKKSVFIFLTYGNLIDIPYFLITRFSPFFFVDIHEIVAQDKSKNVVYNFLFSKCYRKIISNVIIHSDKTKQKLKEIEYQGKVLFVPHFKYSFNKEIDYELIDKHVIDLVDIKKINLLFFGNINYNKGIDLFIDAINTLDENKVTNLNFIIAGKNVDSTFEKMKIINNNVKILFKHINDNELVYLFSRIDYVVLPYRKTTQSGIIEMAFYFKKPIIASPISYFSQIIAKYPSFGVITDIDKFSFSNTLLSISKKQFDISYFDTNECNLYLRQNDISIFLNEFDKLLKI